MVDAIKHAYEQGLKAGAPPDGVVAQVRLPVSIRALNHIGGGLMRQFGKDLRMTQRGEWLVFMKPNPEA